jgi:hypothetical protein
MRAFIVVVLVTGLIALFGCIGEGYEPCKSTEQVMSTDEQVLLGFSLDELSQQVAGPHEGTFTYTLDGSTTQVAVELVRLVGDVTFYDLEPKAGSTASECGDYINVNAEVSFATDDGAFNELLEAEVHTNEYDPAGQLAFSMSHPIEVEYDQLAGTYQVPDVDPADCSTLAFSWHIVFTEAGSEGAVNYSCRSAVGEETDDGETIMMSEGEEVGSW